jgi:hypothetical protein
MQNTEKYIEVCKKMLEWLKESNWQSYDPYDAGLSPFVKFLPNRGWWILQHLLRLSPVNFRPILGIQKQVNAKGLAHSMQACLKLYRLTNVPEMILTAQQLADRLLQLAKWEGDRCSWNYPFPYITRGLVCRKGTNIVNNSFVALALLDAYEQFGTKKYLETALAATRFVFYDIGYFDYKNGQICFYYAPKAKDTLSVHNANMVAAALFYRTGKIINNDNYVWLSSAAARYTLDHQLSNGLWHYSERPNSRWIDCVHTGFVLDSLMLMTNSGNKELLQPAINRGMESFKQFLDNSGRILHFIDKNYPEDIRSYAQFIQTATLFSKFDLEWLNLAASVANYAINTMISNNGTCYYRRYKYMVIKTPFIRWSFGPMLYALSQLVLALNSDNISTD